MISFEWNQWVSIRSFLRLRGTPGLPLVLPCFRCQTCSIYKHDYLQNVAKELDSSPLLFRITLRSTKLFLLLFILKVLVDQLLKGLLLLLREQQSQVILEIRLILHQNSALALVGNPHPPTRSDDIVQIPNRLQKHYNNPIFTLLVDQVLHIHLVVPRLEDLLNSMVGALHNPTEMPLREQPTALRIEMLIKLQLKLLGNMHNNYGLVISVTSSKDICT